MTRTHQDEEILLTVLRDNMGDWKDIDSLRSDPRVYQRMGAHPGVLGQLLARLERRGQIERDIRGNKRIARAVMTPESEGRPGTLRKPLVDLWGVEGCPDIAVGIEENGTVVVVMTEGMTHVRLWDGARVAALQQALDAAEVASTRIQRERAGPPERPHRNAILSQLYVDGPSRTKDLSKALPGIHFNLIYSELLRLRDEGKVTEYGRIWKLADSPTGRLPYPEGSIREPPLQG